MSTSCSRDGLLGFACVICLHTLPLYWYLVFQFAVDSEWFHYGVWPRNPIAHNRHTNWLNTERKTAPRQWVGQTVRTEHFNGKPRLTRENLISRSQRTCSRPCSDSVLSFSPSCRAWGSCKSVLCASHFRLLINDNGFVSLHSLINCLTNDFRFILLWIENGILGVVEEWHISNITFHQFSKFLIYLVSRFYGLPEEIRRTGNFSFILQRFLFWNEYF